MLILLAYVVRNTPIGISYLDDYWDVINTWGNYLVSALPNPGDQLCTDDFMGPSPQNVNLAAKGNVGLAAYAQLLEDSGESQEAERYRGIAQEYTAYWLENGYDKNSQTYKLQFNLDNTWSQKYNIYFQYVLNIDLYPDYVMERELAYYIKNLYAYGFPLDNRANFTKADWEMWCAAVGTDDQFNAILNSIYNFVDVTPQRVPFTDWYWTQDAVQRYFRARPVVGGIWAKVLLAKAQNKLEQEPKKKFLEIVAVE